jgi:hypothetical protein
MGVMPMKEDDGVQELYTRDHGTVKVDKKSWQDGGFHIVLCPNGAYQHANGLPVKSEKEIKAAFGSNTADLDKALDWFKNRHDQLENPVRPISFHPDGFPVFADGSVPDFDDLYSFFKPGPILTAAIVSLQQYNERKGTGVAPKELRKAAPPSAETVTEPSERMDSQAAPDPTTKERDKADALRAKERIRVAKSRAAKKAKSGPAKSKNTVIHSPSAGN